MDIKLEISKTYLDEALKASSIKCVGEVCSNLETVSKPEELKQTIKNTIYQNFRDLKAQIEAFNSGVKFISNGPKTTK
jgi:GMP synthase PP-ATPase subunit